MGDLGIALKADVDDYNKAVASAGDITGSLTGIVRGLGSAMRGLGVATTVAAGVAGGAMVSLSRSAARVNEAFREVDTIASQTANTQEKYGELVSFVNTEMGVNADRLGVISALYKSLSAGISDTLEAQEAFLKSSARLSVVGRVELATAVDVLSTAINAYGENAMTASRASDALFATVQFGKTTLEELAPVMGRVIALGSDMNVAIEELGASMAVLTRTGFESRIAATGLRAVLRGLMKPSQDLEQVLRDIALEQNLFASSMENNSEQVREVAEQYRNATRSLNEWEDAQKSARSTIDDVSLKLQEAQLLQQAIEQGRRESVEEVIKTEELQGASKEKLSSKIEKYRLELSEARIEEERARQKKEELQSEIENVRQTFKEEISTAGDLQGSIGQLVVENKGFVETLTEVRERAQEQGISMSDLFDRSRGLQAALALLGDEGEELNEIYRAMSDDGEITEEEMAKLQERFGTTRDEIEELRQGVTEVSDEFETTKGDIQDQRDAMSELREAAQDLGQTFRDSVNDRLVGMSDAISDAVDDFRELDESTRESIGTFAVLATSIGLVLGPLLLIGGQIALIASAMGSMFIPFVLTAGSVLGILARGLLIASEDGERAQEMFVRMEGILSSLIGFVTLLKSVFVDEVLPGMRDAAQGIIDVYSAVVEEFSGGGEKGENAIRTLGSVIGNVFSFIGTVLSENADGIASFLGTVADIIFNRAIPAFVSFGNWVTSVVIPKVVSFIQGTLIPTIENLWDTFNDEILPRVQSFIKGTLIPTLQDLWSTFKNEVLPNVQSFIKKDLIPAFNELKTGIIDVAVEFRKIAKTLPFSEIISFLEEGAIELITAMDDLVETVGVFLQENDELIAKMATAVIVFAGVASSISALVSSIGPAIASFGTLIGSISSALVTGGALLVWLGMMASSVGTLNVLGTSVVALGGALSSLINPITLLIAIIAALSAAWVTDFRGMRGVINDFLGSAAKFVITLGKLIGAIINRVNQLTNAFLKFGGVSATLITVVNGVKLALFGLIQIVKASFNFVTGLLDIFRALMLFLMGDFDKGLKVLKEGLKTLAKSVMQFFRGTVSVVVGLFMTLLGFLAGPIVDGLMIVLQLMVDAVIWLWKNVGKILFQLGKDIVKAVINVLGDIIKWFLKLPGRIAQALIDKAGDLWGGLNEIGGTIMGFINDLIDTMFEKAKEIPGAIADGIRAAAGEVGDAAGNLAGRVTSKFPNSPSAEEGPLSPPGGPEGMGKSVGEGIAEGISSKEADVGESGEVLASEFKNTDFQKDISADSLFDGSIGEVDTQGAFGTGVGEKFIDSGMNVPEASGMSQDMPSSTGSGVRKIVIKDKAIYFEEGAFQGVSDEELPRKVEKEVGKSLDELVRDLEAKGREASLW